MARAAERRGAMALLIALALALQTLLSPFLAAEARQRADVALALGVICATDGAMAMAPDGSSMPDGHQCPDCCTAACLRLALDIPPVVNSVLPLLTVPARPVATRGFEIADLVAATTLAHRPSQPRAPPFLTV